ncbi:hypothetical protein [Nocardioides mesophilus]|uniref:Uncharacterized protein n=1 Tax=Nocardioides mesophilus TaxID=433659 RepID=A0A7G9RDD1_9ACTN|nr:hypothetical protein [Nocardioides mesophilus]QNN53606.1 hypothetical protein H9L09_04045 [Nocardioides mesophilus]
MRWEERLLAVFDDLEQQADGLALAVRDAEVPELARAAYAEVDLASRLHASVGHPLTLTVAGVGEVAGELLRAGRGWCLVGRGAGTWVVRTEGIVAVRGLSEQALGGDHRQLPARLGLGSMLRSLAEATVPVAAYAFDASVHTGRVRRVGADFFELWEPATTDVAGWRLVPFHAISALRPVPEG